MSDLVFPETLDDRRVAATVRKLAREDFSVFAQSAFRVLHGEALSRNWHIDAIAHELMRVARGDVRRLIISMPPRTMKSFIASVCYPAWLLGRNPAEKIICVSYAHDLSSEFGALTLRLMRSDWYRRVFPATHVDPKKAGADRLVTTRGGSRYSTSTGGTLTGRGGGFIIVDDPVRADDAHSEARRESASRWFRSSVLSRLNNPKTGRIIVVAQRLHMQDLPGQLLDGGGWHELRLPLIADRDQEIALTDDTRLFRPAGDILHEDRFDDAYIAEQIAAMGERDFEAQYNQRPMPPGGALFRLEWLKRYDRRPGVHRVQGIFQSWDTAYEVRETNDYSVCTTWALSGRDCYLLDVYRERLEFWALEKAVLSQREKWKADLVIVERAGSGISLGQNLTRNGQNRWLQALSPEGSKQDRASRQTPKFERGEIWVPEEAPWLEVFEDELASFPHGRHDDQVDSVTQFLAALDTGRLLRLADTARGR